MRRSKKKKGGAVFMTPVDIEDVTLNEALTAKYMLYWDDDIPENKILRQKIFTDDMKRRVEIPRVRLILTFKHVNFRRTAYPMSALSNVSGLNFYDCIFPTKYNSRDDFNERIDPRHKLIENVNRVYIAHCRKIDDCYFLSHLTNEIIITQHSSVNVLDLGMYLGHVNYLNMSFCIFYFYKKKNTTRTQSRAIASYLDFEDLDSEGEIINKQITVNFKNIHLDDFRNLMLDLTYSNVSTVDGIMKHLILAYTPVIIISNLLDVQYLDITGCHELTTTERNDLFDYPRKTNIIERIKTNDMHSPIYNMYAMDIHPNMELEAVLSPQMTPYDKVGYEQEELNIDRGDSEDVKRDKLSRQVYVNRKILYPDK